MLNAGAIFLHFLLLLLFSPGVILGVSLHIPSIASILPDFPCEQCGHTNGMAGYEHCHFCFSRFCLLDLVDVLSSDLIIVDLTCCKNYICRTVRVSQFMFGTDS